MHNPRPPTRASPALAQVRALKTQLREAQDALLRVEAYFGASAMAEANAHRGWLRRALALGADGRGPPSAARGGYGAAPRHQQWLG